MTDGDAMWPPGLPGHQLSPNGRQIRRAQGDRPAHSAVGGVPVYGETGIDPRPIDFIALPARCLTTARSSRWTAAPSSTPRILILQRHLRGS